MPLSLDVPREQIRGTAESLLNGTLAAAARARALAKPAARWLPPAFVIVGSQRCGTTSLYRYLCMHPQIRPALTKEVHYFDLNYLRGTHWYAAHFATKRKAAGNANLEDSPMVTGEASPYYMFHPQAVYRLGSLLPETKIVVMLRDPIQRAISHYKHEYAKGYETADLLTALRLERSRLAGEEERLIANPSYNSFSHQHYSYASRGHYLPQLQRLFDVYPTEQVHIINSSDFYSEPGRQYRSLLQFLGLADYSLSTYKRYNAYPSVKPTDQASELLVEYFAERNSQLYDYLGRDFGWHR